MNRYREHGGFGSDRWLAHYLEIARKLAEDAKRRDEDNDKEDNG